MTLQATCDANFARGPRWRKILPLARVAVPAKTLSMKSTRLEAFSDGVIAIIITIMVLEL